MQAGRRIALGAIGLPILHDRALTKHRFGAIQAVPRDVDHRGLEVREREVGVDVHAARERLEPFLPPGGMRQAELVAPVSRLERDRAAGRRQRIGRSSRATSRYASVA